MSYLKLKCNKYHFCWGSAPHPAEGADSAPPVPLAKFKGASSMGNDGRKKKGGKGGEVKGEGNGKWGGAVDIVTKQKTRFKTA